MGRGGGFSRNEEVRGGRFDSRTQQLGGRFSRNYEGGSSVGGRPRPTTNRLRGEPEETKQQQRPPQRPAPAQQQDDFGEGPITDGLEGDDIPF